MEEHRAGNGKAHNNGRVGKRPPDVTPHDKRAEQAVFGACLRDNAVIDSLVLRVEDFYLDAHQQIFSTMRRLRGRGEPIDLVTLANALRDRIDDLGGYWYLGELWEAAPSAANAEYYARIVRNHSLCRQLVFAGQKLQDWGLHPTDDPDRLMEMALKEVTAITAERTREARPGDSVVMSAGDLLRNDFPEPKYAVKGIIPEGLSLLAGKPKLGKSWLALNLSLAVCSGGVALGNIEVEGGDVLYLALEDTNRRLKSRLERLLKSQLAKPDGLHLAREWPRQDRGGLDKLEAWMDGHPQTRLVVIDTWPKFRPEKIRGRDQYEEEYQHGGGLKSVADKHQVAILAVCHCRKMGSTDPLEEVSGTTGLTGVVDGVLVLRRERGQHDAALFVTGRDVEEQEIALRWDPEFALWSILGQADEYRQSRERSLVIDLLKKEARPMSPSELAPLLGKTPAATKQLLWRMRKDEWLNNDDGKYSPAQR